MRPYGLERNDCSPRPRCSCCTMKAHGWMRPGPRKDTARRIAAKRGRRQGKAQAQEG